MKLGIMDWGIGGVGLLNKIRERSSVDIVYFSDTGFTPYGKVSELELKNRVNKVIEFLKSNDCDIIAVGCNAASTVISDKKNIFGVIKSAIELVSEHNISSVGIVGGKRTIESEIYKTALELKGIKTQQQIAQPLSARIEAGDLDSAELKNEIKEIFEPLKNEKYILLACTHYPVISEQIKNFHPDFILLDPIEKMTSELLIQLSSVNEQNSIQWMTTGNTEEMQKVLKIVYHLNVNKIERINL